MQEYTFRDELLNLPEAKKYQLSIQISLDGFVVLLREVESVRLLHISSGALSNYRMVMRKLDAFLTDHQLSGVAFEKVEAVIATKTIELLPFDPSLTGKLREWFSENRTQGVERVISSQLSANYQLLFSVPQDIDEILQTHFQNIEWIHSVEKLVKIDLSADLPEESVRCHFFSGYFLVRIYRNRKIELLNVFDCHNGSELIFFLLSAIQAAGCKNPHISYTGNLKLTDAEWRQVKRFTGGIVKDSIKLSLQLPEGIPADIANNLSGIEF